MIYDCSSSQSCDSASCSYFHTQHFFTTPYIPQKPYKSYRSYRFYNLTDTLQTMCRHISYIVQLCNPHRGPDIFSCTLHRLLRRCVPPGLEIVAAGRQGGRESFMAAGQPRARTHACKLHENLGGGQAGEFRGGFAGNQAGGFAGNQAAGFAGEFHGGDLEIRRCPIWRASGGWQAAGNLSQSVVGGLRGGGLARTRACRNHAFFQRFCQKSS